MVGLRQSISVETDPIHVMVSDPLRPDQWESAPEAHQPWAENHEQERQINADENRWMQIGWNRGLKPREVFEMVVFVFPGLKPGAIHDAKC